MSTELTLPAYAKINLFLDIKARRKDGYHDIVSIMQTVGLCDDVTVGLSSGGIMLDCGAGLPNDEKNLAWRAAKYFIEAARVTVGANIKIIKRIPAAAGLAGGSSDAAAVLRAMNTLCGNPLTLSELLDVALRLGSDVPFCVRGGTCLAEGRGELITPLKPIEGCCFAVVIGDRRAATPEQFARLDEKHKTYYPNVEKLNKMLENIEIKGVDGIAQSLYNVFDEVNDSDAAKALLTATGAQGALTSGSGPSVFGIFTDPETAKSSVKYIMQRGYGAYFCAPVSSYE